MNENFGRLSVLLSPLLLSVDLLIAVRRPMLYKSILTRKKGILFLSFIWVMSISFAASSVAFDGNLKYVQYLIILDSEVGRLDLFEVIEATVSTAILLALIIIYTIVYRTLMSH